MNALKPEVIKVEAKENSRLFLTFANGEERIFDVTPYLKNFFSELKDPEYFKEVFVENGSIAWPNGQDLAYDMLYYQSSLSTVHS